MARKTAPLWFLAGCLSSGDGSVSDTDEFAPDAATVRRVTTHITRDLVGTWEVRVPKVLDRKVAVLAAGIEGRPVDDFDPPLSKAEWVWYAQAADPEHPYRAWYRCSQRCRFEIKESSIWNYGYYPYSAVGSGLMWEPRIDGRDVEFQLEDHDPDGMRGRIKVRMSKDWMRFRVIDFELDGYRDPHLGQKLELYYARKVEEAE
jgi:hypothetical protein